MNPNENSDPSAADLVALRANPDALALITERLNVKQMGPADHIRTKHEVKGFIESGGDVREAQEIIQRASTRRAGQSLQQSTLTTKQCQGQRM